VEQILKVLNTKQSTSLYCKLEYWYLSVFYSTRILTFKP